PAFSDPSAACQPMKGASPNTSGERLQERPIRSGRPISDCRFPISDYPLVPVVLALVRPLLCDADVARLLVAELRELSVELAELEAGDLLVEPLGHDVDAGRVLGRVAVKLDLGHHLVREGRAHHE